jgi:hypothetical protein
MSREYHIITAVSTTNGLSLRNLHVLLAQSAPHPRMSDISGRDLTHCDQTTRATPVAAILHCPMIRPQEENTPSSPRPAINSRLFTPETGRSHPHFPS